MNEGRGFASLSSGLLARKGAAKPAMRPQGWGQMGGGLEDLGWNDMGQAAQQDIPDHVPSSIAALTPAPRIADESPAPPPVVEQQRAIAESFAESEPEPEPEASVAPEPVFQLAPAAELEAVVLPPARTRSEAGKAKAAFTLRLDTERHLRLRLASAVTRRSAQQLVTEALDNFLTSLPELDTLAKQVPATLGTGR